MSDPEMKAQPEHEPVEPVEHTPAERPPARPPAAPPPVYQAAVPSPPFARGSSPHEKTPVLAAVLSLMPGMGNVYNGLYARGVAFFVIVAVLFRTAFEIDDENLALLIPALVFFWLFNIFDAYRQATLINHAVATGARIEPPEITDQLASGMLLPGVVIGLIGLIGALDLYFQIDVWRLLRNWPIAALVFGGWLIWSAVRGRRAAVPDEI